MNEKIVEKFLDSPMSALHILGSSFEQFIRFFHWYIYHQEFIFKPFHMEIIHKLEDIAFGRNKKRNLMINLPPRFGKSSIMKYFCAWSYMLNSSSNCIYTSYSDELATSFSKDIREIVTSEAFVKFTGIKLNKAKIGADYWATEQGGGFRAAPLGGSLTGFGCFSYGTKILTEFGPRKIGDIIEEEQHIKIASLNKKTHNIEYKYPSRWIKNQKQEFLRIITNDGLIINCSTDHKFYTDKGIVRADELTTDSILPSNPLYHVPFYSKFFGYFTKRMVFIADKISLFLCGNVFVDRDSLTQDTDTFRFSSPINTTFNITNVVSSDSVVLRYVKIASRVCSNLFNIFYRKFVVPVVSSVSNTVLFVVRLSSISKVFNKVVLWVSIKMANTKSFFLWTKKCFCNKCVNGSMFSNSFLGKVCNKISLLACPKRKKSVCSDASNSSYRRNLIKPFVFRNRKPLFIYRIGHYTSYCFTIPSNHNIFLCGSQELLVRNCGVSGDEYGGCALIDDPLKASNVKSQAEMQNSIDYYLNTLKSRANNQARTPFILIMQRLALEDLAGYIIENEKEDWDIIKIPALNEETGEALWEEKFSAKDLLKLKKLSPFVYYGQYQQEPIVVGGSVFKTEWFKYYNPEQFYEYQCSFITSDTAQKKAEHNDYTVFSWWGKTVDNKLHLLDMLWGKFDAHELKQQVKLFWEKCCNDKRAVQPYAFYIEEKGSGIGVIQELVKTYPLPLLPIMRNRYKNDKGMWVSMDKFSRAMTTIPYIANGWVYLPKDEKCDISNVLLAEAAAFKADLTHKHDDKIDTLCDAVEIAFGASSISSIFI